MSFLDLDSRWRRFNDPDRACPCCGRRFSGVFDIGFDSPGDWPHGPRPEGGELEVGRDRLASEFCRLGGRYFLRGVLLLPLRGSDEHFAFGPWAEVAEPVFRACLDSIGDPEHPFAPARGLLANTLPGFEASLGASLAVTLPDPDQRPLFAATEGKLAEAQAQGLSFDDLLDIYAAFGDDLRPHLAAD